MVQKAGERNLENTSNANASDAYQSGGYEVGSDFDSDYTSADVDVESVAGAAADKCFASLTHD